MKLSHRFQTKKILPSRNRTFISSKWVTACLLLAAPAPDEQCSKTWAWQGWFLTIQRNLFIFNPVELVKTKPVFHQDIRPATPWCRQLAAQQLLDLFNRQLLIISCDFVSVNLYLQSLFNRSSLQFPTILTCRITRSTHLDLTEA